jgi:hypothetical protein
MPWKKWPEIGPGGMLVTNKCAGKAQPVKLTKKHMNRLGQRSISTECAKIREKEHANPCKKMCFIHNLKITNLNK